MCAYLGSNSAHLASGPQLAGTWHIYGHTCWIRVRHKNAVKKKKKTIWWICSFVWIGRGPDVHCVTRLKTLRSHCDLIQKSQFSYKLELISMQTCTHISKSLGWACCDFASWNWIATHNCTSWHPNSILSAGQLTQPQRVSRRKCEHSRCPHHDPIIQHSTEKKYKTENHSENHTHLLQWIGGHNPYPLVYFSIYRTKTDRVYHSYRQFVPTTNVKKIL